MASKSPRPLAKRSSPVEMPLGGQVLPIPEQKKIRANRTLREKIAAKPQDAANRG
jgi:hypothetical protein